MNLQRSAVLNPNTASVFSELGDYAKPCKTESAYRLTRFYSCRGYGSMRCYTDKPSGLHKDVCFHETVVFDNLLFKEKCK